MQSEQVKMRFGRCPYCRAMIYQDPKAVIYYCSKCRTPIRGKNPEPANDDEYALAQLEILSFDTMSVFSDELETSDAANLDTSSRDREAGAASSSSSSPYRAFTSVRTGRRSAGLDRNEETGAGRSGSPLHDRVSELRPTSRRTRRPLSADLDAPRDDRPRAGSELDVPRTRSASCYHRRASPLSSRELEASMDLSGHDSAAAGLARSPLTNPAFQKDLLQALENLRKLIVAVEEPCRVDGDRHAVVPSNDKGTRTVTRRDSRLLRRLESQLTQALPSDGPRQDATTTASSSSSSSSASSSRRGGVGEPRRSRASRNLCRPILGGTPFVACDKCSELLQLPVAPPAHKLARLQCGGCDEVLAVTLPASTAGSTDRPRKIFSAPQPAAVPGADDVDEYARARRRLSGEHLRQGPDEGPLHRVLGYSSVSSVLRSRRYDQDS